MQEFLEKLETEVARSKGVRPRKGAYMDPRMQAGLIESQLSSLDVKSVIEDNATFLKCVDTISTLMQPMRLKDIDKILLHLTNYRTQISEEMSEKLIRSFLDNANPEVVLRMQELGWTVNGDFLEECRKLLSFKPGVPHEGEIKDTSEKITAIHNLKPIPLPNYLQDTVGLEVLSKQTERQNNFTKYHQKQVNFAANYILKHKASPTLAVNLMDALAIQRQKFALESDTYDDMSVHARHLSSNLFKFGQRRLINYGGMCKTPFNTPYDVYGRRVTLTPEEIAKGGRKISFMGVHLTTITKEGWRHESIDEWNTDSIGKRDVLMAHFTDTFNSLCNRKFSSKDEAARAFGAFHWLGAHLMPWERGSASIMEQLVDALWIHHFQWAPEKKLGVSLDCEALIEADPEIYASKYPSGFRSVVPDLEAMRAATLKFSAESGGSGPAAAAGADAVAVHPDKVSPKTKP